MPDGYSAIATDEAPDDIPHKGEQLAARVWIRLLGSLGLILLSAKFTMNAAVVLAAALGVGTEVIALSAVAFGTSLPEIVIATMAVRQGKIELAVGNITGSNVFNAFAVMGVARAYHAAGNPR